MPYATDQASEHPHTLQPLRLVFNPVALRQVDADRLKIVERDWMMGRPTPMDVSTFERLAHALVRSDPVKNVKIAVH